MGREQRCKSIGNTVFIQGVWCLFSLLLIVSPNLYKWLSLSLSHHLSSNQNLCIHRWDIYSHTLHVPALSLLMWSESRKWEKQVHLVLNKAWGACVAPVLRSLSLLLLRMFRTNASLTQALDPCYHPWDSKGKESARSAGDPGSIPGSRGSPGEGNGSLLQYSVCRIPWTEETWWATVHGVTKTLTELSDQLSLCFMIQRKEVKSHLALLPFVRRQCRRANPALPVVKCNNAALLWIQQ